IFWLRGWDLNHTVSLRLGHGSALTTIQVVIHFLAAVRALRSLPPGYSRGLITPRSFVQNSNSRSK
ncbi:MAG: hypothetical protein KBS76_01375, partial [Ruminococcus sp.]|nr:hypothetical protein [Candidatus Apopatosoma intestinale]